MVRYTLTTCPLLHLAIMNDSETCGQTTHEYHTMPALPVLVPGMICRLPSLQLPAFLTHILPFYFKFLNVIID